MTRLPSVANTTVSTLKVSSAQLLPFQGLGTGEKTRTAFTVLVKLVSFGTSAGQEVDRMVQRRTVLQRDTDQLKSGKLSKETESPVHDRMFLPTRRGFHPKYLAMETILKRGRKEPVRFFSASPPVPVEEKKHRLKSSEERNWR